MMFNMKQFISDTYHFILSIVMLLPIHNFRIFFLRFLRMKIGKHTAICRGVDIRTPYRVFIGSNTTVNKHVVLDGRGEIFIGSNVDIAQEVNIWSLQHDYNSSTYSTEKGTVIIEDYVWLASRVLCCRVSLLVGVRWLERVVWSLKIFHPCVLQWETLLV